MAVNNSAVGTVFTADKFSFGTIDNGSQVITYTENQPGVTSGATATITSVVTTNGVTTITAQFAGSTSATVPNATFTGTVPANNASSIILTGNFPGQATTNIYLTNIASQQPGMFGMAMVAAESQGVTYAPQQMVCFASGTSIRTARGDVAVEALAVGDLVVTASGEQRPIRWLGHRTIDCRRHPRPQEAMPVRIAAHAFAPGKPARDLVVSSGHAICVDLVGEILIPTSALINGSTIAQFDVDSVTYWHIELDSHDVLFAEGLKAESYCEMGNRTFFSDSAVVAFDASPDAQIGAIRTHADFCRPFFDKGAMVEVVRSRLADRALALGWILDRDPLAGLAIVADGRYLKPVMDGLTARFSLPSGAADVWLVSEASVPMLVGESGDLRRLGLNVCGLAVEDGASTSVQIELDSSCLSVGFHEPEEDASRRWTDGRAHLPCALWQGYDGDIVLRVDLAGPVLSRWIAPLGGEAFRERKSA